MNVFKYGILTAVAAFLPNFANAAGANVLTCTNGTTSVVINKSGESFEVLLTKNDENISLSKITSLKDLTQPADHPFNTQVRLALGGLLGDLDLRLGFQTNVLQVSGKTVNARLNCQVDAEFQNQLKIQLREATRNAM